MVQQFIVQSKHSNRGRVKQTRGVQVGCALRIRIDQYTGPPRRQYLGLPGKSIRMSVEDTRELDKLFAGLVNFLRKRPWRK